MFAGALNICSSKEYIYVMDDALSIYIYIYIYIYFLMMDVFSLFRLYVYKCREYTCSQVHSIYSLKNISMLWM